MGSPSVGLFRSIISFNNDVLLHGTPPSVNV